VFCWGANASGEVGDGTTTMRSLPVQVSTGVPGEFAAVGVGAGASCGIVIRVVSSPSQAAPTGGTIVCWGGDGTAAALGRGTAGPTTPGPAPIASTLSFRSVGVGNGVACGRSVDDSVLCWGNNSLGQLGQGPSGPASSAAPLPIVGK